MLKDEINCLEIKQKGAGLGRRQAHSNEFEVSSAYPPRAGELSVCREKLACQEQTQSQPPLLAVPGERSLTAACHPAEAALQWEGREKALQQSW